MPKTRRIQVRDATDRSEALCRVTCRVRSGQSPSHPSLAPAQERQPVRAH